MSPWRTPQQYAGAGQGTFSNVNADSSWAPQHQYRQLRPWGENNQQSNNIRSENRGLQSGRHDRSTLSQATPDTMSPQDIIIAVMGITGSGKTTFISRCVGEDVGIGHGLRSCTQDVAIHSFRYRGRVVRMIDTPGFDDTSKADVDILNNIAFWLSHAYRAQPQLLLSGIIYLHPISDVRMAGTAGKNLEMMKRLCGEQNLSTIWLATTMWQLVPSEIGNARERELKSTDEFWGGLIRHGSHVRRHMDTDVSAFAIIDDILARRRPVVLNIQRQMVDENKDVDQTDAGRYLRRNVIEQQERVRRNLARSADELDEMLAAQDAVEVDEILERQQRYHRELEEKDRSLKAMKLDMDTLRDQKAKELADREAEFEREKAAQDTRMAELEEELRQLRTDRESAVKQAESAAEIQRKLDDANLKLMLQNDQTAISSIDQVVANRKAEEERQREIARIDAIEAAIAKRAREVAEVQNRRTQVVKQENIFKTTMKVSMAETLVHGVAHYAAYAVAAVCSVM